MDTSDLPPVPQPAPDDIAPQPPEDLSPANLAEIARDVVIGIKPHDRILRDFNLTDAQFKAFIETNEFYKQALKALALEWNSAASTQDRIRMQSAAAYEAALPVLAARMQNKMEPLREVVEVGKLFAKSIGVDSNEQQQNGPGEKFVININLGADKLHYEKETIARPGAKEIPPVVEGESRRVEVRAIPAPVGGHGTMDREP